MTFQADCRYDQEHGMFDFPQADVKTRLLNAIFISLTRHPVIQKTVFSNIKYHMIERFGPLLRDAESS
ncbi:MAG: hypothetical protein WCF90_07520 [Methanomicrobiales archaeon]